MRKMLCHIAIIVLVTDCAKLFDTAHAVYIPEVNIKKCDVFQTGTLEHTILQNTTGESTNCTVTCRVVGTYPTQMKITLEREGEILRTSNMENSRGYYSAGLDSSEKTEEGNYSCKLRVSRRGSNDGGTSYILSRHFQIYKATNITCKSTIGNIGVLQESAMLYCVGDGYSWGDSDSNVTADSTVKIGQDEKIDKNCTQNGAGNDSKTCKVHIEPLKLDIKPTNFNNSQPLLSFNCSSHPPRLIHWAVYSANGNILDIGNQEDKSTKVNTKISIDQSAGFTSISIEENPPGGNGIQRVVCYTYDTQTEIRIAHLDSTKPQNLPYIIAGSFMCVVIAVMMSFAVYKFFKSRNVSNKSHRDVKDDAMAVDTMMTDNVVYESPMYRM